MHILPYGSLPLVVKSAVCAGSFHPPTAKPALQVNRMAMCCTQTSTRGRNSVTGTPEWKETTGVEFSQVKKHRKWHISLFLYVLSGDV